MSTVPYAPAGEPEDLGLKFGGSKRFEDVRISTFNRLQSRLDHHMGHTHTDLAAIAALTVERTRAHWPEFEHILADNPELRSGIDQWIRSRFEAMQSGT